MTICILILRTRPFTGREFHERGVGGTQAALVVLAEGFARLGHEVTVANTVETVVTERGVCYCGQEHVRGARFDLVLLVRDWAPVAESIQTSQRLLLLTDVDHADRPTLPPALDWTPHILLMSKFQERRLLPLLGERFARMPRTVTGLPIDVDDYSDFLEKREPLLLYCSVPDRGLAHLRKILPVLQRRVPGTRLIVTSDTTLWGVGSQRAVYQRQFNRLDGVEYVGAVDRPELVELQKRARVLAYPCHFIEGFCLSAAECLVSGAVPVTTNDYALVDTVGDRGVLIDGHPGGFFYRRRFVSAVEKLLTDDQHWLTMAKHARTDGLTRFAATTICNRMLDIAATQ